MQGLFFWQSQFLSDQTPYEQVIRAGHMVGSHAHSHPDLTTLSFAEQYEEINGSKLKLEKLNKRLINWFRPPYGLYNEDTINITEQLGLDLVLWQVASWDWKHEEDPGEIIRNVIEHVSHGDIILLHELPQTVQILPELIQRIRAEGFQIKAPHTPLQLKKGT